MKQGRSLAELASELDRQSEAKADYLVPTRDLRMVASAPSEAAILGAGVLPGASPDFAALLNRPALLWRPGGSEVAGVPSDHAHGQLAERLQIPRTYYRRMEHAAPELLCTNANHWLERAGETRLLRCLDGKVRGFLSDRYRPMDHYSILSVILPILREKGVRVESCEVTETRLYIKGVSETIKSGVRRMSAHHGEYRAVDDTIHAGLVIQNSEVGAGALSVAVMDWWLICRNGAVRNKVVRKTHLGGRNMLGGEGAEQFFSEDTNKLTDRAIAGQLRDTVDGILSQDSLAKRIEEYERAKGDKLPAERAADVVEQYARRVNLSDGQRDRTLAALVAEGEFSRYGLGNAVTRMSQDVDDYDAASDLEALGGKVYEMPATEWAALLAKPRKVA